MSIEKEAAEVFQSLPLEEREKLSTILQAFTLGYKTATEELEARKFAMAMSEKVEKQLRGQIEKMKRHCNCKHRDSEGYCEVKRTYLMDLSYDGCDKWELED